MFIKDLYSPKEFDVFLGEGWENWVRVRLGGPAKIKILASNVEVEENTLRLIFYKIKTHIKKTR